MWRPSRCGVPTDRAIPIALLVTEAISNAYRHAFPSGRGGTIDVTLQSDGAGIRLVADDGVGLSEQRRGGRAGRDARIGLTLIEMLAKQIGGQVAIRGGEGTQVELTFHAAAARQPAAPERATA